MDNETIDNLCKDCGPTFTAFLERMAAHNKEQMTEVGNKVVCPTCGKVHEFPADGTNVDRPRAS